MIFNLLFSQYALILDPALPITSQPEQSVISSEGYGKTDKQILLLQNSR